MNPVHPVSGQPVSSSPSPTHPVLSGIATSPSAPRNDGQPAPLSTPAEPMALAPRTTAASGHPEVEGSKEITAPIEVIPEQPEISPELEEHIEAVQHGEIQLPGPIEVGTHEGQPVTISPAAPQQPNIILPMTQSDFVTGQKQPVASSWRWLYEFIKRIMLMFPGRTVYRPNS